MVNGEGSKVHGLSQAGIGRALNLSGAAITKLKKQGMPVDSVEAAQLWRRERQNVAQRKPAPVNLPPAPARPTQEAQPEAPPEFVGGESHDAARTRREIAEADLAELKRAELRGELVRAAAVRLALSKRATAMRESLLQLPARVVPLLVADPSAAAMDRLLRAEIVAALNQLHEVR